MIKLNIFKGIIIIASTLAVLGIAPSSLAQDEATDSSDTIREKVQQKVTQVLTSPKAYIGTVTDISESTLQISKLAPQSSNETQGEIQQISTNSSTTFVNTTGKTSKVIKFSDIAIGDFVIAMGYKNGNNVLEAKRILITNKLELSKRQAIYGNVKNIGKNEISITISSGNEVAFETTNNTTIMQKLDDKNTKIKLTDIEEEQKIIVIGTPGEKMFEARTIQVLTNTPVETPQTTSSPTPKPSPTPKATAKP